MQTGPIPLLKKNPRLVTWDYRKIPYCEIKPGDQTLPDVIMEDGGGMEDFISGKNSMPTTI